VTKRGKPAGNDDELSVDRATVADGQLELRVQSAGRWSPVPMKTFSANSENRPLYGITDGMADAIVGDIDDD